MDYTRTKEVIDVIEIGQFQEIHGSEYPKLAEQCESGYYKDVAAVAQYLRSGESVAESPGILRDVLTGARIPERLSYLTDGKYAWRSDLAYYVEKYNLRLPEDFLNSINIH